MIGGIFEFTLENKELVDRNRNLALQQATYRINKDLLHEFSAYKEHGL